LSTIYSIFVARSAVTNAIKHRMEIDCPINYKVALLKEDIDNGPYHVFGCHDKCARLLKVKFKLIYKLKIINKIFLMFSYFCSGVKPGEINLIPEMEQCGLWQDIISAKNLVAHHSESLIFFVNNNCVENYNSIVAKYTGGKRVNFSLRGINNFFNFK